MTNLNYIERTSETIAVTWNFAQTNCMVQYMFFVTIRKDDEIMHSNRTNMTRYIFTNLMNETDYVVEVIVAIGAINLTNSVSLEVSTTAIQGK